MTVTPQRDLEMPAIPIPEILEHQRILFPAQPRVISWRDGLPTLDSALCTLREVRLDDAPSLHAHLYTEEVARFIPPPPSSVEAFEDYVRWAHLRRSQGHYACFGIVPAGHNAAVGVIQIHVPGGDSTVAEWGFAIGHAFWGTGIFQAGAERIRHFAFSRMGVRWLEARSVLQNGRGNGALRKMGATPAGTLKGAFEKGGVQFDQALWFMANGGS